MLGSVRAQLGMVLLPLCVAALAGSLWVAADLRMLASNATSLREHALTAVAAERLTRDLESVLIASLANAARYRLWSGRHRRSRLERHMMASF